jgi:hypothetical protein
MPLYDSEAAKTTVHSWMDRRSSSQNPEKQIQQGLSGPDPPTVSRNRTWFVACTVLHLLHIKRSRYAPLCTSMARTALNSSCYPYTNVFNTLIKVMFGLGERENEMTLF